MTDARCGCAADVQRQQVRRLWDLLTAESAARDRKGRKQASSQGYCAFHCCIGKVVSAHSDDWSLSDAVEHAKQDWIDDIARFSNDAVINGWFAKVKIVLQKKAADIVAEHGWRAMFMEMMDGDGDGDVTLKEFNAALRNIGVMPHQCSDTQIRQAFVAADVDSGGSLSGEELARWLRCVFLRF